MKKWTKEGALKTLKELADEADRLHQSTSLSTEHAYWLTKCHDTLEEIFGLKSRYYLSFAALRWNPVPGTPIDTWTHGGNFQAAVDATYNESILKGLKIAKGFLLGAIDYLKERELDDVYSANNTGAEVSLILKVLNLAEFQLRKIIRNKPEKEKEIQDAFENLLIGAEIPYSREADSIEYSSKTYIPDFSLPKIDLAIEVKLCNREERERQLPEEINDDILAYQTKYQNLLFIVYDLGSIRDVGRFCGSFEKNRNVTVKVIKH